MRFTQHFSNNRALGAPKGVPIEECTALPITDAVYADGTKSIFSFWQPSAEDLALLMQGKPIRLEIRGTLHPMVSVGVDGDGIVEWKKA